MINDYKKAISLLPNFLKIRFILLTGFVSFITVKFLDILSKQLGKNRQRFSLINLKTIVSSLGGIKEIKVNNKEKEVIDKFSKNSEDLKINNYIFQVLQQVPKNFARTYNSFFNNIITNLFVEHRNAKRRNNSFIWSYD